MQNIDFVLLILFVFCYALLIKINKLEQTLIELRYELERLKRICK